MNINPIAPVAPVNHGLAYRFASNFVDTIDNGFAIGSTAAKLTWSFGGALANTITKGYDLGITGSIKETAKWCFGVNNYDDGWDSLKNHDLTIIDKNGTTVSKIKDKREAPERLGEAMGHIGLGLWKAGMTTAIALGEVTMLASDKVEGVDSTIGLSQTMAKAANALVLNGGKIGLNLLQGVASGAVEGLKFVAKQSDRQIVLTTGLVVAGLYITFSEGVKAADAKGWRKVTHGLVAAASGVGSAVLINYPLGSNSGMAKGNGTNTSGVEALLIQGGSMGLNLLQRTASSALGVLNVVQQPGPRQIALTTGLVGTGLYFTYSEGVKASNAQGWRKVKHSLTAVALGIGTVATAVLINYPVQAFQGSNSGMGNNATNTTEVNR